MVNTKARRVFRPRSSAQPCMQPGAPATAEASGGNPPAAQTHHLREAESRRRCPRERRPGERGRHDVGAPRRGPEAARGRCVETAAPPPRLKAFSRTTKCGARGRRGGAPRRRGAAPRPRERPAPRRSCPRSPLVTRPAVAEAHRAGATRVAATTRRRARAVTVRPAAPRERATRGNRREAPAPRRESRATSPRAPRPRRPRRRPELQRLRDPGRGLLPHRGAGPRLDGLRVRSSVSCISRIWGSAAVSLHWNASSPGETAVGGLFSGFEAVFDRNGSVRAGATSARSSRTAAARTPSAGPCPASSACRASGPTRRATRRRPTARARSR